MASPEFQEMILKVIEHAETAKLSEFQLITTWAEYRKYKGKRKAFKLLTNGLRKSSNRLFKRYCRAVTAGISDFTTLLAYQRLYTTREFYLKEIETLEDMLDEYETYLFSGNLFWAYIGFCRSEYDMIDFRKRD
jgi:hypothetical protein